MMSAMKWVYPWLLAVWTGAAIMAYELLAVRLLAPIYGMGIDVWAVVIAATMGALALGYVIGGLAADRFPSILTATLPVLIAGLFFLYVWGHGRTIPWRFLYMPPIRALSCSSLFLLAPPLLFLAMVEPAILRVVGARGTSRTYGLLLAANTIGGIIGSLGTGLGSIPVYGVSRTLFLLALITLGSGLLGLMLIRKPAADCIALLFAVLMALGLRGGASASPNAPDRRVLASVESRYGTLDVTEDNMTRALRCNGIIQSALPVNIPALNAEDLIRGGDYAGLLPFYRPRLENVLLIGMGAGLHVQGLRSYGIKTTCVEIDPAVVQLAQEYFDCWADVTIADGRAFLARDRHSYDAIIIDAFSGSSLPEHLYTLEAFQSAAARLTPEGVLVLHLIAPPRHRIVESVMATLARVFPHVTGLVRDPIDRVQNVYLFGSRTPLELPPIPELIQTHFSATTLPEPPDNEDLVVTDDRSDLSFLAREVSYLLRMPQILDQP